LELQRRTRAVDGGVEREVIVDRRATLDGEALRVQVEVGLVPQHRPLRPQAHGERLRRDVAKRRGPFDVDLCGLPESGVCSGDALDMAGRSNREAHPIPRRPVDDGLRQERAENREARGLGLPREVEGIGRLGRVERNAQRPEVHGDARHADARRRMLDDGHHVVHVGGEAQRRLHEDLPRTAREAKPRRFHFELRGVRRMAFESRVRRDRELASIHGLTGGSRLDGCERARERQVSTRRQGMVRVGPQALDLEVHPTVPSDHVRSAPLFEPREARPDTPRDDTVRALSTIGVDGQVFHVERVRPGRHMGDRELRRPSARDAASIRRLGVEQERAFPDANDAGREVGIHVRQVDVQVDAAARGEMNDGACREPVDLIASVRSLRGDRHEAGREPLEEAGQVDVTARGSHDRVAGVEDVYGGVGGHGSVVGVGVIDAHFGPSGGGLETKVGLRVQVVFGGDVRGEGLLEGAKVEGRGHGRRVRGEGQPKMGMRGACLSILRSARELEVERARRRAEVSGDAPTSCRGLGRGRRQLEGEAAERVAGGHASVVRLDERQRHGPDIESADRRRAAQELRGEVGRGDRRARWGRREGVEGGPPMLVGHHGQRRVGDRDGREGRAPSEEEGSEVPANRHVADAEELGRELSDLVGGADDEVLDVGAREAVDADIAVVDLDAARRAGDALDAALDPGSVERMKDDDGRGYDEHG
jgi:hypothetical protein